MWSDMQQPMSLLGLESPVQGILDSRSRFHNGQIAYTALLNHQAFDEEKYLKQPLPFPSFEENQPLMDELLEQLLSFSEFGELSKVLLNQGSGIPSSNSGEASIDAHQDIHKLLDMPSMAGGFMDRIEHDVPLAWTSSSIMSNASLMKSPAASAVSGRSTGARDCLLSPAVATQLSQPYGCSVPNFQMVSGDTTQEIPNLQMEQTSSQIDLLGKRCHDPGLSMDESGSPSPALEKLFHLTGVEQAGKSQIGRTTSQLRVQDITAASRDISNQSHGGEVGPHQPHTTVQDGIAAEPFRRRVRARRGQATDPHSIAERQRRERIAERMRSLQELVPNSNKTDRASMLDEIIEYVMFLQLQLKVLSISRLGGGRVVSSSVAGLHYEGLDETGINTLRSGGDVYPLEDGVSLTEQHIAQLMEEDMGSAMQYLQTKGLCLMPIALANHIKQR